MLAWLKYKGKIRRDQYNAYSTSYRCDKTLSSAEYAASVLKQAEAKGTKAM